MLNETVFRSGDLPVGDRFDAWREVMDSTHAPMRLESPRAGDFHAHVRVIEVGAAVIWPATFEQLVFLRTPRLIRRSDPEVYHLSLLLEGEAGVSWGRRETSYAVQDYHVNDSSRPYRIWTGEQAIASVGVEIPKALLPLPSSHVDEVLGRPLTARSGPGALLAGFLKQLCDDAETFRPADGPRLATTLADLVALLFAHSLEDERALEPETRTRALTLRIKDHIQRNLHDPDLTPTTVAEAHHISRGYLHRLFRDAVGRDADAGETVAAHIRRRRLEGAARDLTDPGLSAAPVHVVAARWGFPRAAEFTRAFRTAYGVPPGEYRRQAVAAGGGAHR
ncbi:AraC-like ligand-binding domain-containing protein [Actinacidiphila yeochonensis]|uniref:AraC-like ligand-binding domain-containing protein n=1 Tax=Actinacidiphila yeochonensis TaxID=89050 RepID=UPI000565A2CB|nr:helix-turn-helix domain-containing protein [Actinacidiphila yeochonensis]